jgi:hypothetical protein
VVLGAPERDEEPGDLGIQVRPIGKESADDPVAQCGADVGEAQVGPPVWAKYERKPDAYDGGRDSDGRARSIAWPLRSTTASPVCG